MRNRRDVFDVGDLQPAAVQGAHRGFAAGTRAHDPHFHVLQAVLLRRGARALGLGNIKIMWKHVLPNAMVATLTFLPFILNGSITTLTSLDFLGFGLPPGSPSLGELLNQGKSNLQAPWLGLSGFIVIAVMLSLLIFIGEAVRDAFDPRKGV